MKRKFTNSQTLALIGRMKECKREVTRLEKMLLDEYDRLDDRLIDIEEKEIEGGELTDREKFDKREIERYQDIIENKMDQD